MRAHVAKRPGARAADCALGCSGQLCSPASAAPNGRIPLRGLRTGRSCAARPQGGPPGCLQGRGCPRRRPIQSNRCCPAGATVRLSSSALQPAEAPRPSRRREAARCAEADPRGYQRRLKLRCAPALRDRRRFAPAHCAPRNRPWLCRRRRAPSVRCRDVGTTRGLGSAGDGGAHSGRSALGTERSFVMRLRRDAYRSQSVRKRSSGRVL